MKAKLYFGAFVLVVLFLFIMNWVLNHAYIVVDFWTALKMIGVCVLLAFGGYIVGYVQCKHNQSKTL